jgi:hypothetical protein
MIIITRSQTGYTQRAIYPDDQWYLAEQYELGERDFMSRSKTGIPFSFTVEFKPGYPEGYSLYEGAGCAISGNNPREVFKKWTSTSFERSIENDDLNDYRQVLLIERKL